VPRSSGKVLLLDLWGRGASTVLVNGLLSLSSRLLGVALDCLGSVLGVLVGEALDLSCLLASDLTALLELSINDLLVLDVDERGEVGYEGGDQGQAPERNELDEEVGDQRSEESLYKSWSANVGRDLVNLPRRRESTSHGELRGALTAPVAYTFSAKTMR
jgi:hypothetical protein